MLSFIDAFLRYHQIPLYIEDQEKTTFVTDRGLHCYRVMSFVLMNARAIYMRLVNKIFEPLLEKTMEVHMDDMIVKSMHDAEHDKGLWGTFEILQRYDMKLRPKKCVSRVQSESS